MTEEFEDEKASWEWDEDDDINYGYLDGSYFEQDEIMEVDGEFVDKEGNRYYFDSASGVYRKL